MGKKNSSYLEHEYPTEGAAKAAVTRIVKKANDRYNKLMASKYTWDHEKAQRVISATKDLAIAEAQFYHKHIEQFVERVNMMSGKKYTESINTPNYMSPSCESYWSM